MQAKSSISSGCNNNNCNQNKDAALLTLKPAQGQSTKSGHAHDFRHGGGGDDDDDGYDDDVAMLPANGKQPTTATAEGRLHQTHGHPLPQHLPSPGAEVTALNPTQSKNISESPVRTLCYKISTSVTYLG
ncbi:uncharacterized protein LOC108150281 [Drosophila elegans]|uniref:uncharacterized protein LOC108150281 n=1 Tax=Drosophila elegans TaxID=30023 RepID=UPI0007E884CC|nr:uncharacterized protein LOC108150281 [Drosophila elegans]